MLFSSFIHERIFEKNITAFKCQIQFDRYTAKSTLIECVTTKELPWPGNDDLHVFTMAMTHADGILQLIIMIISIIIIIIILKVLISDHNIMTGSGKFDC